MGTETLTQAPKKPKMPLDYALRCMHDAMEMVFDYDHDPNFVPSADQLVLFEMLHKQIVGYSAMSLIIVKEALSGCRQRMWDGVGACARDPDNRGPGRPSAIRPFGVLWLCRPMGDYRNSSRLSGER